VRLRSCVRAKTKIGLANLTYNMQRMVWLIDQATAACSRDAAPLGSAGLDHHRQPAQIPTQRQS
jgi:hypothetical protein